MNECVFCHNAGVENGICRNCGRIVGSFQVHFVKSFTVFTMTITDKYLIFNEVNNVTSAGEIASTLAGGLIGSALYRSAKKNKSNAQIGMLDLSSVSEIRFIIPQSAIYLVTMHIFFKNGKDLLLGISEPANLRANTPKIIEAFGSLNLNLTIQECQRPEKQTMQNPIVKKNKLLFTTVSSSAAQFLQPFKGMNVVE